MALIFGRLSVFGAKRNLTSYDDLSCLDLFAKAGEDTIIIRSQRLVEIQGEKATPPLKRLDPQKTSVLDSRAIRHPTRPSRAPGHETINHHRNGSRSAPAFWC